MKLVLDTNVVASAMLWGGLPQELMHAGRARQVTLVSSVPMLAELTGILGRPKFAAKVRASLLSVDALVDAYAALTLLVRPVPMPRVAPDPDDDVVLGTALAGRADAVVTGDKALLSVAAYQGVRLLTVRAAVALLQR